MPDEDYRANRMEEDIKDIRAAIDRMDERYVRLERYIVVERAMFAFIGVIVMAALGLVWSGSI